MTKDDQAPATKKDIKMLMDQMGQYYDKTDQKISGMREEIVEWKQEIKEHFDVVAENIHHDMLKGALNDKVEQHEDRIQNLERHTGLVAV